MGTSLRMNMGTEVSSRGEPDDDGIGIGLGDGVGDGDESREPDGDEFIPRGETGLRIGLSVLFVVVASVIETLLAVIVLFELISTLATERPPSPRVRDFANRIISYYYRLGRYLTYNESRIPFPFSDFPDPVEPDAFSTGDSASGALGIATGGEDEIRSEPGRRSDPS